MFTVKAASFLCEGNKSAEGLRRGLENEHSWVKAVGPANIRGGGEFFSLEQLIAVLYHLEEMITIWKPE